MNFPITVDTHTERGMVTFDTIDHVEYCDITEVLCGYDVGHVSRVRCGADAFYTASYTLYDSRDRPYSNTQCLCDRHFLEAARRLGLTELE